MTAQISWTADRQAELARQWVAGVSIDAIANELGVSRAAASTQARRMDLPMRRPCQSKAARASKHLGEPAPRLTLVDAPAFREDPELYAENIAPPPVKPLGTYQITDLGLCMCRWPIGEPSEPGFGFCGDRTKPGKPYCEAHCEVAFLPEEDCKRINSWLLRGVAR